MYTGEFSNLKCTWIGHDINRLYELMTIIYRLNQHILKSFVLQLTLSQGHNYMEFL